MSILFFLNHKLPVALYFFFSTSCSAASWALFAQMPKSWALARAMGSLANTLQFSSVGLWLSPYGCSVGA